MYFYIFIFLNLYIVCVFLWCILVLLQRLFFVVILYYSRLSNDYNNFILEWPAASSKCGCNIFYHIIQLWIWVSDEIHTGVGIVATTTKSSFVTFFRSKFSSLLLLHYDNDGKYKETLQPIHFVY